MYTKLIFAAVMLVLSALDIKKRYIPNLIIIPVIILMCALTGNYLMTLVMFVIGAVLFAQNKWCGGDVKLLTLIGAFFGIYSILIFVISLVLSEIYRGIKKQKLIPYCPFIYIASLPFLIFQ